MTKQNQHVSDDDIIEYFGLIPVDLVISGILSKLPVKSLAQCRCVSKLWSSIIRHLNYKQLFPVKALVTPSLLLAIEVAGDLLFYSSPQPQNSDHNSSLAFTFHHTYSGKDFYKICRPVGGLVCLQHSEKDYTFAVICNPITGESLTLPKLRKERIKTEWKDGKTSYSFGYDPIEKVFKVLCITWLYRGLQKWPGEYQVLTLGTGNGNLLWRKIQCHKIHYPLEDNGICIHGVLYYPAMINSGNYTMVCFDVRSEKFSFINIGLDLATKIDKPFFNLIDYNGKLGVTNRYVNEYYFELWVLEDAEEHKWSHSYKVHREWVNCVRFRAKVPELQEYCVVYPFSNFVEDVKLM